MIVQRRPTILAPAYAAFAFLLFVLAPTARATETTVDLELVLAVDVSSSMNPEEQEIQRAGYVTALTDPAVVSAILSGVLGRIALTYVEWAGPTNQSVVVSWRLIDSEASARRFAAELDAKPFVRGTGTSISAALLFTSRLFADNGFEARRRVVDISGDGPNNLGPHLVPARDVVVGAGIIINGLPLMIQPAPTGYAARPDLADYFRDCVIGGPGAFVLPANSTGEIATAIRQKLVQEIAMRPASLIRAAAPAPLVRADCMIGQKEFHE